jgi:hypothetical protein
MILGIQILVNLIGIAGDTSNNKSISRQKLVFDTRCNNAKNTRKNIERRN